MNSRISLMTSVLKRNNYELRTEDNRSYIFQQLNKNSEGLNRTYYLMLMLSLIGLFLILNSFILFGAIILITNLPVFLLMSKQRGRQTLNFDKEINVKPNQMTVVTAGNEVILELDDIRDLGFYVEKTKDISIGSIHVEDEKGVTNILIEIFGDSKNVIEDETKMIADFIADILNDEI